MTEPKRLDFAVMSALLRQGRYLAALSLLLLAVALLAMLCVEPGPRVLPWTLSLLAALAQLYYAIRVDLDARLFDALSREADADAARTRLDAALKAAGLLKDDATDRPWSRRFAGARRLLVGQAATLAVQVLALLWACWG